LISGNQRIDRRIDPVVRGEDNPSMRPAAFAIAFVLSLFPLAAARPDVASAAIERHIAYLSSQALEGREVGTPGGALAEAYVADQLRAAGVDAVEFQEFGFPAGSRLGPASALAIDGQAASGDSIRPYSFSAAGEGEWPAVLAGYGIDAHEKDEKDPASDIVRDDFAGLDAAGKAVVVLAGSPDGDAPHGKFGAYQGARAKALAAKKKGAAALVILQREKLPLFDGEEVTNDVGMPVLAALEGSAAKALGIEPDALRKELDAGRTPARALDRKVRLRADVAFERRTGRNVLGWLRARAPGSVGELVIVGAHHDHLGRGGSGSMHRERRGEVHGGADDNASGVAGVLELARELAARAGELRRPILFMTFAGEERGLLGSEHYTHHPVLRIPGDPEGAPALKPFAMINMDMIGRLREEKLMLSGAVTSKAWPAILEGAREGAAAAGLRDLKLSLDNSDDLFGTSDHMSFYSWKVPVLFFFTGAHKEYHTPDDVLWKKGPGGRQYVIDVEGERRILVLVEEIVLRTDRTEAPLPYEAGLKLAPRVAYKAVLRLMPDFGAEVEGMKIAAVTAGGPAAEAGLKDGDIIVRFGDVPVRSLRDYMVGLEQAKPGKKVEIEYLRDGKKHTAEAIPITTPRER
jgi:aminopeptidase YwaD